jgi:hypothetical protein
MVSDVSDQSVTIIGGALRRSSICARGAKASSARWREPPNRSNYSGETIVGRAAARGSGEPRAAILPAVRQNMSCGSVLFGLGEAGGLMQEVDGFRRPRAGGPNRFIVRA